MKTIIHGSTEDGKRFTIAGIYKQEDNQVNFGVSLCAPHDQFTRKTGRQIAEGRAEKKPTLVKKLSIIIPDNKDGFKQFQKLALEVVKTIEKEPEVYQEVLTEMHRETIAKRKQIEIEIMNKKINS